MICCENNFCLYWQDDTCLLENISLSLQGVCQSCVCVDIGGSHICSAVVDLATGQLCGEPHTDKVDAAAGARTIAGAWAANIRRTAAASGIGRIRCAGFAFPGPFDYERQMRTVEDKIEAAMAAFEAADNGWQFDTAPGKVIFEVEPNFR